MRAQAEVEPVPEREVAAPFARGVEAMRLWEHRRVAVRGGDAVEQRRVRAELDAGPMHVFAARAREQGDRRLEAQAFLDDRRDLPRVGARELRDLPLREHVCEQAAEVLVRGV